MVGLVAGIAGQSTLGNLIAGVQVAFSDSLRPDDVVVVDRDNHPGGLPAGQLSLVNREAGVPAET